MHVIVFGATGAVGRELVDYLIADSSYNTITIPVRREIEKWSSYTSEQKSKLKIMKFDNLDFLSQGKDQLEPLFGNLKYNSVFCCLGSLTGKGEEFKKVDFVYTVQSCNLCEKLSIDHFSIVSSQGANSKSCFLYFKTKGLADEECLKMNVNQIDIFRPGMIHNRDNDKRCGESFLSKCCCCIGGIEARNLGKALYLNDLAYHKKGGNDLKATKILSNKDILNIASH